MSNPADEALAIEVLRRAAIKFVTGIKMSENITEIQVSYERFSTMVSMRFNYYYKFTRKRTACIDVVYPLDPRWPMYYLDGLRLLQPPEDI